MGSNREFSFRLENFLINTFDWRILNMPNYEYLCHGCGYTFEEFFRMDDRKKPEKKPCPQCKEKKIKQECLTAPNVAMDPNMRVDGPAKGGFKDVMNKVIGGPSMKGTKAAKMMKDRYGL